MVKNALRAGGVEGLAALAGQPANPAEHLTKMLGGKMLEGLTELAGAPGSLISALPKAEVPPSDDPYAPPLGPVAPSFSLPTTEQMQSGLRNLGAIQQPIQQPRNEGERILGAGFEGLGSTVPLAGIGGLGGLLARTGKTALQGFGSGVGSEVGRDVFGEAPNAGSLAGLLAGQAAAGGLYGMAGRGANALRGSGNPVIDAYDLIGVKPRLAGDVTGRPMLQGMQQAAMSAPYGGGALHAARQGANEFGAAVENQASRFGLARTPDEAGYALQQGGRNWMQGFRNAQQTAENAVSARVPGTTEVSLAPVSHVLDQTARELPDAPHIAAVMTNPTFRDLSSAIRADLRNPPGYANDPMFSTEGTIPTQSNRVGLSWDSARALRTRVGQELENALVSRDGTDKTWKRIYGAISETLGDTAAAHGAGAEWQAANQITNQGHQFIENTLSNIINHPGAQNSIPPSAAANFALGEARHGGTRLAELRAMMPEATNQLASYKLREMASALPNRATEATPTSATTFSTDLNRLRPEARTALFGNYNPELDALQTVAERGKETYQRYGNPSGTAGMMHWLSQLTAPFAVSGAYQAGAAAGGPTAGLVGAGLAAVPYAAGPILGGLTTKEALTRYLAAPVGGPGSGASRAYRGAAALPSIYGLTDERPR
jgi:hypothetical protein